MIKSFSSRFCAIVSLLSAAACTTEVTDRTSRVLVADPPVNAQTFVVEVASTSSVRGVEIEVPGLTPGPMARGAGGRYAATLPLPVCAGTAAFTVDVLTTGLFGGTSRKRFPQAGRFTHEVIGQPTQCAEFAGAFARTFTVNRAADFVDTTPGDGICRGVNSGGQPGCSLRAAVMEANASPGDDLIRLGDRRHRLTLTGGEALDALDASMGDLDVTETLTIEGTVGLGTSVTDFLLWRSDFRDVRQDLRDDPDDSSFAKIDAGGIDRVMQVARGAVLQLRQVMLTGGRTTRGGGGVLNDGTLTLERVAIVGNRAESTTSRTYGGGGIQNSGVLVAQDALFARNAVEGFNPSGGALYNSGDATIRRTLIAYNSARFGSALRNSGPMRLENVTLHGNVWDIFGLVAVVSNLGSGEIHAAFTTFSQHTNDGRTMISNSGGQVSLRNSLLLDNRGIDYCRGAITTVGGNVTDAPCALTGRGLAPDLIDARGISRPGSLQDLGGFTPVYPIRRPSVTPTSLIDVTERGLAPAFPFTDQRGAGFPRRLDPTGTPGGEPDPGAYEVSP